MKINPLVGIVLITLSGCAHQPAGPSASERLSATLRARNEAFYRSLDSISRLPPEQRVQAAEELQRELDKEQAEADQQNLSNSIDNLADAVRGY